MSRVSCIAVSEEVRRYLLSHNPRLNVDVIENGFDADVSENREVTEDGVVRIGYVGRLDSVKGVDLLVDAYSRVRTSMPNLELQLHIVGEGELSQSLREKLLHGIAQNEVNLWGYQAKPFSVLRNMSIVCVPSRFEGFGMVFYEALARNHVVLASDIEVFKKDKYDAGVFYFERGSLEDLTSKMMQMLTERAYSRSFNRSVSLKSRSLGEMVADYDSLLVKERN